MHLSLFQSQYKGNDVDEEKSPTAIQRQAMTRFRRTGSAKFPKLEDCAHFHYDFVSIGNMQVVSQAARCVVYWKTYVSLLSQESLVVSAIGDVL